MLKSPSMRCDGREWTNGRGSVRGGRSWNLPETSPVTLASLNSPRAE